MQKPALLGREPRSTLEEAEASIALHMRLEACAKARGFPSAEALADQYVAENLARDEIAFKCGPAGFGSVTRQLDHLDRIARDVAKGRRGAALGLSTGERVYVALAANDMALLDHYTIAEALARIGPEWTAELIRRWQYLGNPQHLPD